MFEERSLKMTAQYWTITGYDMWMLNKREVFDFKNLTTDEVITCGSATEVNDQKFLPVTMPKVKKTKTKVKKHAVKKTTKKPKAEKSSRRGPRARSKYKGVSPSKTAGKFRAAFWDKEKGNVYLGTFNSELLAAAAYEEHIGNKKEAKRLRNEYEEGNCRPEASEPNVVHKNIFPEDTPKDPGQFPSEQ